MYGRRDFVKLLTHAINQRNSNLFTNGRQKDRRDIYIIIVKRVQSGTVDNCG